VTDLKGAAARAFNDVIASGWQRVGNSPIDTDTD
jgi:hypothetical protein